MNMKIVHPSEGESYQVATDDHCLVVAGGEKPEATKVWLSAAMIKWIAEVRHTEEQRDRRRSGTNVKSWASPRLRTALKRKDRTMARKKRRSVAFPDTIFVQEYIDIDGDCEYLVAARTPDEAFSSDCGANAAGKQVGVYKFVRQVKLVQDAVRVIDK